MRSRALLSSLTLAAFLPLTAHAATMFDRLKGLAGYAGYIVPPDTNTPGAGLRWAARIIGLFVGTLLTFIGVVFMVLMIGAGLKWMTARGNEQEVEKAKATIKNASVGLLVVALAYAIVTLISSVIVRTGLIKG